MVLNQMVLRCFLLLQQTTFIVGKGINNVNIALHKPATQSSIVTAWTQTHNGHPGNAVDGGYNNSMSGNSCTFTSDGFFQVSSAWWEVDLLSRHTIGDVRMLNRDEAVGRLHDPQIVLFENKGDPRMKKHCITHKGPAGPGWLNLSCETPVTGRYVRIIKPKKDQGDVLTLCEVEIYEMHTPERKRISGQCILYEGLSMSVAQGEDEALMARSRLHCASLCGTTTGCKGFRVTGKEENQTRWKRGQVPMGNGITTIFFN